MGETDFLRRLERNINTALFGKNDEMTELTDAQIEEMAERMNKMTPEQKRVPFTAAQAEEITNYCIMLVNMVRDLRKRGAP